jgi:CBS domain containing-hemolysin-like protein
MLALVLAVSIALLVSALCSLVEATLLSITPSQVADLSARDPGRGAIWRGFKQNIQKPIAVILLINTSAHTMGASIAGAEFDALYGDQWIAVFSLVFTLVMLQFTEILPKTLGVRYSRELASVVGGPLALLVRVLNPFLQLVYWINRPFEGRRRGGSEPSALEEISALASAARFANQIGPHQELIIQRASRLSAIHVRDVMIPADQIAFLSSDQSLQEAFIAAHLEAHTRFPICEGGSRDRVLGYVNFKELVYSLHVNPVEPSLAGIIRPMHFAAPGDMAAELLRSFVDEHVHIAIVREGDRTVGLVTFEDLVEELVGEREDEFDRLPRMLHTLSGGVLMAGGGVPAADVLARLGLPAEGVRGALSIWLAQRLPGPPATGASYREGGYEFAVRRTRRGRIFEVAITPRSVAVPS